MAQEKSNSMKLGPVRAIDGVFSDQVLGARDRQEDAVAHRPFNDGESLLVVLADGMGGHQGGEVASRTSVDVFVSAFFTDYSSLKIPYRLFGSLERANRELEAIGKRNAELEGMGSTLVAATFSSSGLSWISVGDSLLLRVRGGKVQRLNEDHSMAPLLDEAVKRGTLTPEQAVGHKDRNALRSAVSGAAIELIDVSDKPEPLLNGDVILLASDGVLTLTYEEIALLVNAQRSAGARAIGSKLLEAVSAKNKRRQDNATIAAVIVDRSSVRDSRLRTTSLRAWGVGFAVAAVFALLGLALGVGGAPVKAITAFFTTVAGEVKTLELPGAGLGREDSAEPQPVDITEPSVPIDNNSAAAPSAKPSTPNIVDKTPNAVDKQKSSWPSPAGEASDKQNSVKDDSSEPHLESVTERSPGESVDVGAGPKPVSSSSGVTEVNNDSPQAVLTNEEKKPEVPVIPPKTPNASAPKVSVLKSRPTSATTPNVQADEKTSQKKD